MKVTLMIPVEERRSVVHGEHFSYHGKSGEIVCAAGNGGAWVRFDGMAGYVGCPLKWLVQC